MISKKNQIHSFIKLGKIEMFEKCSWDELGWDDASFDKKNDEVRFFKMSYLHDLLVDIRQSLRLSPKTKA